MYQPTENALRVLQRRYLARDSRGEIHETPDQMMRRVAKAVAAVEKEENRAFWEEEFYALLASRKFLPNTPCLLNAGKGGFMSACVVLPVEDSVADIFSSVRNAALIQKSGGGVGYNFSKLRPTGALVKSSGGVTSGPLSFIDSFSSATESIQQGCLTGNTYITTNQGLLRLDEIIPQTQGEHRPNPELRSYNNQPIETLWNNGIKPTTLVKLQNGLTICGTPDHLIEVVRNDKTQWIRLDNLTTTDYIPITIGEHTGVLQKLDPPSKPNRNATVFTIPTELTEDVAWLVGFLHGDGHCSWEPQKRFGFTIPDGAPAGKIVPEILAKLFTPTPTINIQRKEGAQTHYTLTINSTVILDWLQKNGLAKVSSTTVKVPKKIRMSPPNVVAAYLRGLFEADGAIVHNYAQLNTASYRLAKEVHLLLLALGIPANLFTYKGSTQFTIQGKIRNRKALHYAIRVAGKFGAEQYWNIIGADTGSRFRRLENKLNNIKYEDNTLYYGQPELKQILAVSGGVQHRGSRNLTNPALRKIVSRYCRRERTLTHNRFVAILDQAKQELGTSLEPDPHIWYTRLAWTKQSRPKMTYDLTMTNPHQYIANTLTVHNSFRRGANIAVLNVDHPDIWSFIHAKTDLKRWTNFNISVMATDAFMHDVLHTPEKPHVVQHEKWGVGYLENSSGTKVVARLTKESAGHRITVGELFAKIVELAHANGEPGLLFYDRINQDNVLLEACGPITACNPCSEQPLHDFGNCVLGSINLSNTKWSPGDYNELNQIIPTALRFLDNIIDVNVYPIPELEQHAKSGREVGLGVMGWADTLFQRGIRYGSPDSLILAGELSKHIRAVAETASEQLAEERGPFPYWTTTTISKRRNSRLLTVAPTGSISILADCSGGIEPLFSLAFKRHILADSEGKNTVLTEANQAFIKDLTKIYTDKNKIQAVLDYAAEHGTIQDLLDLPAELRDTYVCAHDIPVEEHIAMQAAWQKNIDSAISKSLNLRHDASVDDVHRAYVLSWQAGNKGVTVYRDGCRNHVQEQPMQIGASKPREVTPRPAPDVAPAIKIRQATPIGNLHVNIVLDPKTKEEVEIFAQLGKAGDLPAADLEGLCRIISLYLRLGGDLTHVHDQLKGIGASLTLPTKYGRIESLPDALAVAIERYMAVKKSGNLNSLDIETVEIAKHNETDPYRDKVRCPDCGEPLTFTEGCKMCTNPACAFSAC